jgi:hypothetical protein
MATRAETVKALIDLVAKLPPEKEQSRREMLATIRMISIILLGEEEWFACWGAVMARPTAPPGMKS